VLIFLPEVWGSDSARKCQSNLLSWVAFHLIVHTIRIFDTVEDVEAIVIPVHNEWFTFTKELIEKYKCDKVKEVIIGGFGASG
jgi:2-C-methyl-D-erythritol 4-phosphate cytidylyltransferase